MRKSMIAVSLIAALLVGALSVSAQTDETNTGTGEDAPQVSLTIYNQGTALVRDRRSFDFDAGENILNFTDVAASIDSTSVNFKSLTDPDSTTVLEQNYVFDLVDSSALLARYLDERIEIVTTDGETFAGELLSGRHGEVILRQEDGQVAVISAGQIRDMRFPELPGGLITRPTLRWLLYAGQAGQQDVELTYLAGGLSWTADYNILLSSDNTSLDLNGWVTLNNTSGAAYQDAQVKLVAGDVNRAPTLAPMALTRAYDAEMAVAPAPVSGVEQREFFEYNLYEINRRVTVGNNETKQVEFVTGGGVPAHTFYVYDASQPYYNYNSPMLDRGYGNSGITTVGNYLEFTTDEDGGLGEDLPAGRIRVYQEDIDGAALLIGENRIGHTPKGEKVEIYLGNAFDLVGERTQTHYELIGERVIEETYEIRIRNRKDDATVEVRVPEHMFRWTNWEILEASDEYTKTDSTTIEFRVPVEPGEERVITYTVRYRW